MKASRRQVLAAAATAGVLAVPRMAWALAPASELAMIADPSIAAGRAAAIHARGRGIPLSEAGNDLATLFHGAARGGPLGGKPLLGVTGWSGMVVAQGIAREQGRSFRTIDAQAARALLPPAAASGGFVWMIA